MSAREPMTLHRFATCLALVLSPGGLPAAEPPVPRLAWQACPPAAEGGATTAGFDCATATVPIDYAHPEGDVFSLALIRFPATDPTNRVGTLFWNPGGPSDAGTQYLPAAIHGFPRAVRARFDIVSWDPRGMGGRTTPVVQCFDSAAAEAAFLVKNLTGGLPVTPDEFAANLGGRTALNAACVARDGDLLAHVSTADNARDLDLLRQAVGESQLNYYGTSYGTFLGATYINMFPRQLRSAVLDGAVAPGAWAGNAGEDLGLSTFVRLGSDFASAETIRAFLDQCGAVNTKGCAFSAGSPEATRARWNTLLDRAKPGLYIDGQTIDDRDILSYVQSSIYLVDPLPGFGRFPGWVAVGEFLGQLWSVSEGKAAASGDDAPAPAGAAPLTAAYVTSVGRQLAVICGESPNPDTEVAAAAQASASYARAGISPWPLIAYCVGWTARAADPYLGPWDTPTPAPVLVIGNSYDPATAFPSSQRMAQELADGHLLTVNGFGHTALLNPSACAQDYIAAYLIDGAMPPTGAECDQDSPPFAGD